jgi:phage baseplate assembly protein gpV
MATHFNDIQAALDTRLSTLSGGYSIAWPNTKFEPEADQTFLSPSFIPNTTEQVGLGSSGKDETNGLYQIDVVYPAGTGRSTIPDSIADHFKRGTVLTYNSVNVRVRSVSIESAVTEGAFHFVPVTVDFQTYTDAR